MIMVDYSTNGRPLSSHSQHSSHSSHSPGHGHGHGHSLSHSHLNLVPGLGHLQPVPVQPIQPLSGAGVGIGSGVHSHSSSLSHTSAGSHTHNHAHALLNHNHQNHTSAHSLGGAHSSSGGLNPYMAQSHPRSSPHLSHLDHIQQHHPTSAPSTPSPPYPQFVQPHIPSVMSQHQQNQSQQQQQQSRQQPTSYPSPHSYPSPSMSAYAYPPPQQQTGIEPYRHSPSNSHNATPPITLPPITSLNPRQPSAVAPHGSPLPGAGGSPMGPYYPNPAMQPQHHPHLTSSPHGQPMRYPITQDSRIMSGGRHKKEIKRRTKTGCLTCRKRRIKCDEQHPVCRNCQKSKRECLGYDPIFKAQPGPAAIQPAPTGNGSAGPPISQPNSASPYPQMSMAGYQPSIGANYSTGGSTGTDSPGSAAEQYDYSPAIDPALAEAGLAQMPPNVGSTSVSQIDNTLAPYGTASNHTAAEITSAPITEGNHHSQQMEGQEHGQVEAKRIKVGDLLSRGSIVPPPLTPPASDISISVSPATLDEIKNYYIFHYAPALDDFLEVNWFHRHGLARVLNDSKLCELFADLLEKLRTTNAQDIAAAESRVIWMLMTMSRRAAMSPVGTPLKPESPSSYNKSNGDGIHLAASRSSAIQTLVTGAILDSNPTSLSLLPSLTSTPPSDEIHSQREFWRLLGHFITLRDDEASTAKEIDDSLLQMRGLLKQIESRDVIYSIAIARHLHQRVSEGASLKDEEESTLDEKEPANKLRVAKEFVEQETTTREEKSPVVRRICGMAGRLWASAG